VPDNVLFEDNTGRRLRTWMMELCDLHTILRLPTGIFYALGVKTNVMFLTRGKADKVTVKDFAELEKAFGGDPLGKAKRKDQGEEGRFRCFTREQIKIRNDNLDIGWLRDTEAEAEEHLTDPEDIAAAIMGHLKAALEEIEAVSDELEEEDDESTAEVEAVAEPE
jgi:type I restriction enzyme M protein